MSSNCRIYDYGIDSFIYLWLLMTALAESTSESKIMQQMLTHFLALT